MKVTSAGSELTTTNHQRMTPEKINYLDNKVMQVIELIQTKGLSLLQAAKKVNHPPSSLLDHIDKDANLIERYTHATSIRAEILVDRMLKKAADTSRDMYTDEKGNLKPNPVAVQRDRLLTDRMQWYIGTVAPKKYGNQVNINAKIEHTQPLSIDQVNDILKQLDSNTIDITDQQ